MHDAAKHGEDRQRKFEEAECGQAFGVHRKYGLRIFVHGFVCCCFPICLGYARRFFLAAFTDQPAQCLALIFGQIGKLEIVTPACAGFKLGFDQPEQPWQQFLLQAYVLNAFVGNRARRTADNPALDADVFSPGGVSQAKPAQICRTDIGR